MNNKISIGIGIILIAIIFSFWYVSNNSNISRTKDIDVFAIVNGEKITKEQVEKTKAQLSLQQGVDINSFDAATQREITAQIVDMLIEQTLIKQKVEAANIQVDEQQVDEQIAQIIQQFEDQEQFESALELEGLSMEDFRTLVRDSLSVEAYLQQELNLSGVTATQEDIDQMIAEFSQFEEFEQLIDEFNFEEYIIQQKQQELIDNFINQLRQGADIEIFI